MKLRIEQRDLATAAKQAYRRLPSNPANPILGGLLIEAGHDGPATLSGFDLDVATKATLDADTLEPGTVLVSGRLLADVAAAMPAGPVDLVTDDREITLTSPGTAFTLPTMEHRDYPALPKSPGASGKVEGGAFARAVVHAAQAAMPPNEAVGTMEGFAGVHVKADGDELIVSASDRYRIVRHRIPWTPDGADGGELLIPADGITTTAKQMTASQVRIAFPADRGVASLASDRLTVTSRTIAVDFPHIDTFFPAPDKAVGHIGVGAPELLEAVKRASLVNDGPEQAVVLKIDMGVLIVSGGARGSKGTNRLEVAEADGLEGFTAGYRPSFLISLLAPIDGPVRIWFTTPSKPVLIEPIDDDTYRAVCMPIRLK